MSKTNKTARQVILRYEGRIELSSLTDRSKVESAGAKFFDQAGHYCASIGVAWPSRIDFNFPDGRPVRFSRSKLKGPPLTERQEKIVRELLAPMFLEFCESIACTEADREKIKKNKEQYEKAVFGKLRNEKGKANRAGAEFLRGLKLAELYHRENPNPALSVIATIRMAYATPLFQALIGNNTEFVQGILKQMRRSLSERRSIKKRLIETDELRHPTGPTLTWKQILEKYASDYKDSNENFRHLLEECGIPFELVGTHRDNNNRKAVKKRSKNTA
jgi:hypothetical protein